MKSTRDPKFRFAACVLVGVLAIGACGSDSDSSDGSAASTTAAAETGESTGAVDTSPTSESVGEPSSELSGETLVIANDIEPQTLDLGDTIDAQLETWQFLDPIVELKADGSYVPLLAAELPTQTDPADPLTWTVTLREGLLFHDGTPVDAQAVVDWITYLATFDARSREIVDIAQAVTPTVVDPTTVEITFLSPGNDGINSVMSRMLIGKKTDDGSTNPVGTGPYQLREWNRGQNMILDRFPDYYGTPGPYASIEFRYIPDAASRIAAIQSGEADLVTSMTVEDSAAVPNTIEGPSPRWFTFLPDAKGKFADVRLRQALSYALDTKTIFESLFGGVGQQPQCQLGDPSYTGYNPDLSAYAFDQDKARELIAEAGAEGMQFEVLAGPHLPKMKELVEAAVAMWQDVGLDPQLNILPFDQFVPIITDPERQPDLYLLARGMDNLDYSGYNVVVGAASGLASNDDAELQTLLTEAASTADFDARVGVLQEIAKITCDEAYVLFAMNPGDIFGVVDGISFEPSPYGAKYLRVADIVVS